LLLLLLLLLLQVGVDLDRAGTVSWVSSPLMPAPWTNLNVINNWDQVRARFVSNYIIRP
jgi:hypothetical protein